MNEPGFCLHMRFSLLLSDNSDCMHYYNLYVCEFKTNFRAFSHLFIMTFITSFRAPSRSAIVPRGVDASALVWYNKPISD